MSHYPVLQEEKYILKRYRKRFTMLDREERLSQGFSVSLVKKP
jgi:hypothetical protein